MFYHVFLPVRSVWLHLVDRMSVHLAKVIAILDRNSGLEHGRLDTQQKEGWSRKTLVDLIKVVDFDSPVDGLAAFE